MSVEPALTQALAATKAGAWRQAEQLLRPALSTQPEHPALLALYAVVLRHTGRVAAAVAVGERAVKVRPDWVDARYNLANALNALGQHSTALAQYEAVLQQMPQHTAARYNRALLLVALGRAQEAISEHQRVLSEDPRQADRHLALGNAYMVQRAYAQALQVYDQALALTPDSAAAHTNRGNALLELGRCQDALQAYEQALRYAPDSAEGWVHRGRALTLLRRHEAARQSLEQALARDPQHATAWCALAHVFHDLRQIERALHAYDRALAIDPHHAEALLARANAYTAAGRHDAAVADYQAVLALRPHQEFVAGQLLHTRMRACDWRDFEHQRDALAAALARGEPVATPLTVMGLIDEPALQRQSAQSWVRARHPTNPELGPLPRRAPGARVRVGFFSADYHDHPVAHLSASLLEHHDRARFEVFAFSFGPPSQDAMRRRIERSVDHFIDVRARSDRDIARLARELSLDIAIDLGGFTLNTRTGIFAHRAAPVQASYLGFLGTMGADYIDYLIADPVLIPAHERPHYQECVVRLPCYQLSDAVRPMASQRPTRQALGLPETGMVYCCFSNLYKFTPTVFASWMRILQQVPGSVLFLYADHAAAEPRLRAAAAERGVDPQRLVFGTRLAAPDYLARYQLADLFLDTTPYNAGTTASDALWAGLPVLTRVGRSFASRVAASVLHAHKLDELIVETIADYEARAIALAHDPQRLAALRAHIAQHRRQTLLFDAPRFTRAWEDALTLMHERAQAGLPPCDLDLGA